MFDRIYALHDSDPDLKRRGAFEIDISEAGEYNKKGYGIFGTFNDYEGARKKENTTKINFWFADIDDGTKEEQMSRIVDLPVKPTVVIETKNGYHCYWKAIDATIASFRDIQVGLIKKLTADPACKEPVRLLRVPGYNHLKDPSNPFKIKIVWNDYKEHEEKKMIYVYKLPEPKPKFYRPTFTKNGDDKDWWLDKAERNKRLRPENIVRGVIDNTMRQYFLWARDEVGEANAIKIMQELNQDIAEPMKQHDFNRITRSN
jgi:hypothetical protein